MKRRRLISIAGPPRQLTAQHALRFEVVRGVLMGTLTLEQQGQVQELAVAELTRQKERLVAYTTQARFAVAQLVDRAALARTPDDVSKP